MTNDSMHDKILSAIQKGEVKPRPKWHFLAQSALLASGVVLSSLLLVFLSSLIIFSLQQNGGWFAPGFGLWGLKIFFGAVPWMLILAALALIWLLEFLLKSYKFAYQRPMLYLFVGLGLLIAFGTITISSAGLHEGLFRRSLEQKIILGAPLYKHYGLPNQKNITPGEITAKTEEGCRLKSWQNENLEVIVTPKTRLPVGFEIIVGDNILVFGPRDANKIQALGIIRLENKMMMQKIPRMYFKNSEIY